LVTKALFTLEPAYNVAGVVGSIASVSTLKFDKALVAVVQVTALSALVKTPVLLEPTKRVDGSAGSRMISDTPSVRPVLAVFHVFPPSVLLKT
jgi:hypothetical protein